MTPLALVAAAAATSFALGALDRGHRLTRRADIRSFDKQLLDLGMRAPARSSRYGATRDGREDKTPPRPSSAPSQPLRTPAAMAGGVPEATGKTFFDVKPLPSPTTMAGKSLPPAESHVPFTWPLRSLAAMTRKGDDPPEALSPRRCT
jgi:hypothetical protein